ncbi:DedA family protein [Devriesea agamarum]|uniref:DedA family protein n=1 Tax=Devriesea agamarum TaxID=472569 RepID=UPI00071C9ED5|nr:DedA family protein [Devriesea agamarum]
MTMRLLIPQLTPALNASPQTSQEIGGIAGWTVSLMETIGGPGVALAVAAENLFPPIPSEIILPLAGLTASRGGFTIAEALFWSTLGSIVGALALYGLGRAFGRERLVWVAAKLPLVQVSDIEKTEAWFARHGGKTVLFGRLVPIFRSLISIPAGVEKMPVWRFTLLTAIGSLAWNAVLVLAGYALGENWELVAGYVDTWQKIVIVVVIVAVAWFVIARVRANRRNRKAPSDS